MIVWALPPFRQRGTRFFYLFLLMALEDPVAFIVTDYLGYTSTFDAYIFFDLARFLVLFSKDQIIENRFLFGIGFGFILFLHYIAKGTPTSVLIDTFIHFSIFLKLLQIFLQELSFQKIVSIFLIVLIFYQINTVLKFIILMVQFSDLFYYYLVSTIAQCVIAVFFTIYKDHDKRLIFQVR